MKAVGTTLTVWVAVVATCSYYWTLTTAAAAKSGPAAKLVEETLRLEAREAVADRADLLKPALEQSPPCEEAYWQSGYIYDAKRKKWLALDDVRQQAEKDDQLAAYLQVRPKYPDTLEGQVELARWCTKHKLEDQARAHWTQVLGFASDDQEARRQLGYQMIGGKWLSPQELAEEKAKGGATQAALRRWVPLLEEKLKLLMNANPQAAAMVRQQLLTIKDADVAPAVQAVLCMQGGEIALVGIELLKGLQSAQSAGVLAWNAVSSPWLPVGQAAALALRDQEKYDYVPLLLEAAEAGPPPQLAGGVNPGNPYTPGGPGNAAVPQVKMLYRIDHGTSTYSWDTVQHLAEHPDWRSIPTMNFDPYTPETVAKRTTTTTGAGGNSTTVQKKEYFTIKNDKVQDKLTQTKVTENWQKLAPVGPVVVMPPKGQTQPYPQPYPQQTGATPYRTDSLQQSGPLRALAEATGVKGPVTLADWWAWWYDYNEVYYPSGTTVKTADQLGPQGLTNQEMQAQRGDCLAAGTLVATESGPVAIEKIAVGDRVFCCDVEKGCLVLKPVLRTVIRPEGELQRVRAGDDEFECGGGHVFWVAGSGWVKARDLREGMQLHTLRGTVAVQGVESGAPQKTYSLAVADFHTFYAGKSMALTHDNTIRPPTNRLVPGLAADKETTTARKAKKAS